MSVINSLDYQRSKRRAKELKGFLQELDSICDRLYNRLDYSGVWDALMKLEDVRVQHYVEFYEQNKISQFKGTNEK